MNQEALVYLNEALDYIQNNSVLREQIDWPSLREEAFALIADAQTNAETYPAIKMVLGRLGDHHSTFHDPARFRLRTAGEVKRVGFRAVYPEGTIGVVYPNSPAEAAGIQAGDIIEMINGQPPTSLGMHEFRTTLDGEQIDLLITSRVSGVTRPLTLFAAPYLLKRVPQGKRLEHNIGYLNLPELLNAPNFNKSYAEATQALIRDLDQPAISGWIIDLRSNYGGNMWPMIVGVGPILGGEICFSFVAPREKATIFYHNGGATLELWKMPAKMDELYQPKNQRSATEPKIPVRVDELKIPVKIDEPYQLKNQCPPVAVLISQITASAAEFVALAFHGRSHTRSFGEPTCGLVTGNETKTLSDGAGIHLTKVWGADRTGHLYYDAPLLPDYPITIDWARLGTTDDPVLQAAIQWLHMEEGCV